MATIDVAMSTANRNARTLFRLFMRPGWRSGCMNLTTVVAAVITAVSDNPDRKPD